MVLVGAPRIAGELPAQGVVSSRRNLREHELHQLEPDEAAAASGAFGSVALEDRHPLQKQFRVARDEREPALVREAQAYAELPHVVFDADGVTPVALTNGAGIDGTGRFHDAVWLAPLPTHLFPLGAFHWMDGVLVTRFFIHANKGKIEK